MRDEELGIDDSLGFDFKAERVSESHLSKTPDERSFKATVGQMVFSREWWIIRVSAELQAEGYVVLES